jgi:hypothetical protein
MRGSAGGDSQIRAAIRVGARRRCRGSAGSRGGGDDWTRWLVALGLGIREVCVQQSGEEPGRERKRRKSGEVTRTGANRPRKGTTSLSLYSPSTRVVARD